MRHCGGGEKDDERRVEGDRRGLLMEARGGACTVTTRLHTRRKGRGGLGASRDWGATNDVLVSHGVLFRLCKRRSRHASFRTFVCTLQR